MRRYPLLVGFFILTLAWAAPGFAQAPAPAPLVVEPIPSQLIIAPDYKLTGVDGDLGQLAGVYGGTLIDDAVFVGAAGYWLANGSDAVRLTYGGVLIGWSSPGAGRIRFGARGLTGIGTATLPGAFGFASRGGDFGAIAARLLGGRGQTPFGDGRALFGGERQPARPTPAPTMLTRGDLGRIGPDIFNGRFAQRVSDDFFVFEPQGTLGIALFDRVTLNTTAGYRAVAFTEALRDRLNGPTVGFGLEFDW